MMSRLRAAFVIGRRDFVASVWSRAFLLFLMGPLVMIGIGIAFGNVSEKMAQEDVHPSVAVIAPQAEFQAMADARERLNLAFGQTRLPDARPSGTLVAVDGERHLIHDALVEEGVGHDDGLSQPAIAHEVEAGPQR